MLAGAAGIDITPDSDVYLGGYGIGPIRRSKGIASRLFARSLVIGSSGRCTAFLAVDTQGLLSSYRSGPFGLDDIEQAACAERPALDGVFGVSTHSHTAPDSTGIWGGLPVSERSRIVAGAVEAVIGAVDSMREARLALAVGDGGRLLRNQCDFPPHNKVDGRLFCLEASGVDGTAVGRVVVFAAHATAASGAYISSDWCGALAERTERELGGVTLVMPGAIGRTQPAIDGPDAVGRYAAMVTEELLRAHDELAPVEDVPPKLSRRGVEVSVVNPLMAMMNLVAGRRPPRSLRTPRPRSPRLGELIRPPLHRVEVSALALGSLTFVGFPGEAYPNIAWALDQAVPGARTIPVSLCGDQVGYLIYPSDSYPRLLREAWRNDNSYFCAAPSAGTRVFEAAVALIGRE